MIDGKNFPSGTVSARFLGAGKPGNGIQPAKVGEVAFLSHRAPHALGGAQWQGRQAQAISPDRAPQPQVPTSDDVFEGG